MTRRPLPTAPASVAGTDPAASTGRRALGRTGPALLGIATLLLLTACGGSDDGESDDKIESSKPSSTPSESPTATAAPGRPEIKLPADAKNVFEGWEADDPKIDAVLADTAESVNSVDEAILQGSTQTEALPFYNSGTALQDAFDYIKRWTGDGDTWVGTARYFDQKVSFLDDGSAVVIYCIDQSKAFIKDGKSGDVDRSPASSDSYALTNKRLVKNKKDVWQTVEVEAKRGAQECQP